MRKNKMMPNTEIYTLSEFREYMKGKHLYQHVVHWIEEQKIDWREKNPWFMDGFVLNKKLGPNSHYGKGTYGTTIVTNRKSYWEDASFRKVTRTSFVAAKKGKQILVYVTRDKRLVLQ